MSQPPIDDQTEVMNFLADPRTHDLDRPVKRIDTHGACVFLAGSNVYKIKRAVRFPFLDFSTLDKRRRACENEIVVNKDNAPGFYLGVVAVVRHQSRLQLGGSGDVVEWAVHMRRFDENRTLDKIVDRGRLTGDVIAKLADVVLESHRKAPVRNATEATAALKAQTLDTLNELAETADLFGAAALRAFRDDIIMRLSKAEPLLRYRGERGQIRRCHGDLHLRNIVLIKGQPVLFDAIEFDEAIATCDVLHDLAFLLMDLWQRGLHAEASMLLNRYLWGSDDEQLQLEGLAAFPLFLSLRAAIRAKVAVDLAKVSDRHTRDDALQDARQFFATARDFLCHRPLRLIGIGGLSGSGKTTLASRLGASIGRPPGAVHLRSDMERKRMFNTDEFERLPDAAYSPSASESVYRRLRALAQTALRAGQSVIVDAVHLRAAERLLLSEIAAREGAEFHGFWLEGPTDLLAARVAARTNDASDATPEVVRTQAALPVEKNEWFRLDASQPPGILAERIATWCKRG
jgi:aminoglycoside phosphotransferase family enzyme/predicted kinase